MSWIHHIETLVPETAHLQTESEGFMRNWTAGRKVQRYVSKVYGGTGIRKRHTVVPDFTKTGAESFGFFSDAGETKEPSTGERNAYFVETSRPLIHEVSNKTIAAAPDTAASDVTHVITVSCTGFYNPGPDLEVIKALDLAPQVERYNLGFMGCYAAFPALKMADQFCRANPAATVLIVCVEFCTLHLQIRDDLDSVVANSVFADGLVGVVVKGTPPCGGNRGFDLVDFSSDLAPAGEDDMAWDIGDHGFNIVLSKYVAKIIGLEIKSVIARVLAAADVSIDEISRWAVHPGGRAIVDAVEESLDLEADQVAASRHVLAEFGNMSSATVLFVLHEMLNGDSFVADETIAAMAFGPGLTIESSILKAVG